VKITTKEQGEATQAGHNGFSLISSEKLLRIHAAMVQCRLIAKGAQILYQKSRLTGFGALATGKEAVQVGVTLDLQPGDAVFPAHRGFIAALIQGGTVDKASSLLLARAASLDPTGQFHLAAGAALSSKTKRDGRITVVFRDDEAASSGSWQETLKLAGLHRLPILFVCQASPQDEPVALGSPAGAGGEASQAESCLLPVITVDSSDAVAVYRVATEAIAHARKGNGPTLIECACCGWPARPQMDAAKAPGQEKPEGSIALDPILKMERYLLRKGLTREGPFSEDLKLDSIAGFARQLDAFLAAAGAVPNF
jgi:pyruvate dehydrogenase E1 component alpha subunit